MKTTTTETTASTREAMPRTASDTLPGQSAATLTLPLSGSYRTADGAAQIEWELEQGANGPEFSAQGDYDGGAGQCIDSIAEAYPQDATVQRIAAVWRVYHLNGMNAGTPRQRSYLEGREAAERAKHPECVYGDGSVNWYALAKACKVPQKDAGSLGAGHYETMLHWLADAFLMGEDRTAADLIAKGELTATGGFPPEVVSGKRGYQYGERWVYAPIPAEVLAEIASWSDVPQAVGSLGDAKTAAFLARHSIDCRITLSDTKPAPWGDRDGDKGRHHFRITLSAKARRLTFDFWGNGYGETPSQSAILSCIAMDIDSPATFADYCSEYGEDSDSIRARQTWKRCAAHAARLQAFFTDAERGELPTLRD